eukprot:13632648-Ditylum_brightwellii.AAC.1
MCREGKQFECYYKYNKDFKVITNVSSKRVKYISEEPSINSLSEAKKEEYIGYIHSMNYCMLQSECKMKGLSAKDSDDSNVGVDYSDDDKEEEV